MVEPRSVGQPFDEWAPRYDAQIREMVPRYEAEHDHPDTTAEHLAWLVAAGFAAVDVVWKYDDVGVLVAWRAER
jgi:hypothetical protein